MGRGDFTKKPIREEARGTAKLISEKGGVMRHRKEGNLNNQALEEVVATPQKP